MYFKLCRHKLTSVKFLEERRVRSVKATRRCCSFSPRNGIRIWVKESLVRLTSCNDSITNLSFLHKRRDNFQDFLHCKHMAVLHGEFDINQHILKSNLEELVMTTVVWSLCFAFTSELKTASANEIDVAGHFDRVRRKLRVRLHEQDSTRKTV